MAKLYLDPGHGGTDSGAVGNGLQEKALTLKIALKVRDILNRDYQGHSIRMSRTTDKTVSLNQRTNDANSWGADYFVSVHINAGGGTGYEDYIYTTLSDSSTTGKYRSTIHAEIMKQVDFGDRGKKKANLHVLRQSSMPGILTENGFIDTTADANKLKSNAYLDRIALGHANGIAKALGLKKKSGGGNNGGGSTPSGNLPNATYQAKQPYPSGTGVKEVQKALASVYYYPDKGAPNNGIDSVYGPKTADAVKRFQLMHGLNADGIYGPDTRKKLLEVM